MLWSSGSGRAGSACCDAARWAGAVRFFYCVYCISVYVEQVLCLALLQVAATCNWRCTWLPASFTTAAARRMARLCWVSVPVGWLAGWLHPFCPAVGSKRDTQCGNVGGLHSKHLRQLWIPAACLCRSTPLSSSASLFFALCQGMLSNTLP